MPRRRASVLAALVLPLAVLAASRPAEAATRPDAEALQRLAERFDQRLAERRGALYQRLLAETTGPQGRLNRDQRLGLAFVDGRGVPRFHLTDNLNAARTVGADKVWPGGVSGHNLTGSTTVLGELGIWDAGGVRTTHQEMTGRVTQMDAPSGLHWHATHVAGTMIAGGVDAGSKGMSYQARLAAYDWNSDNAEMAAAGAAGMFVSNHSYGFATGWLFNFDGSGRWFWFGDTTVSATEDYGFGFYGEETAAWDSIAWNAPRYTIVKSAGNDRNDFGPSAQPDSHFVWDPGANQWRWSMTVRDRDGGPDGYDTVSWNSTAKNIVTVGAVNDIPAGWTSPASVVVTSFSCWGPTDDGRIKPDLVANGASLRSAHSNANNAYASASGTSMSSPNLAGSLNLLVQHYRATHAGQAPRAATMKALLVHTADEAGTTDGPDYRHGWGLMDTREAADLIAADSTDRILERSLGNGQAHVLELQHAGGPLRVSMAWTDPPHAPLAPAVDPPTLTLINDLDLRVEEVATSTVHRPWVLDPANPANAATAGDNFRDNVEQVHVASAPAGTYRVTVSHKGTLQASLPQAYSIVASQKLTTPTLSVDPDGPTLRFHGGFPNPFDRTTAIHFELPRADDVSLAVYDVNGRLVRVLERGVRAAGRHVVAWNGLDDRGALAPAGVYFARVSAGGSEARLRLVRIE